MKTNFTDEAIGKQKNSVVSKIEPKMLPSRFRERSTLSQRLFLVGIVLLYSAAVGVITFTLLNGLATKMQAVYKFNKNIIIITMIISIITLFTGVTSPIWSRNRKLLFTKTEFALVSLSPIIYIAGYLYLSANFNYTYNDPKKLLFMIGLITLLSNAIPILLNFFKTLINIKRYRNSFIKGILISPGNLLVSASNLILFMVIKFKLDTLDLSSSVIYLTAASFIGGLGLMLIGVLISLKWDIRAGKSMWASVRVTGALPAMMVYTTLLVIGMKFMSLNFETPVVITLAIDGILLLSLFIYVWIRGGIRNLIKTNPIYNNVVLRLFVIFVAITGLVMISMMDKLAELRDFGQPSFTILVVTSLSVLLGVFIAHIGKIIIYTKFFKAIIVGTLLTLLLIILIVMSIIVLKNSEIILAIISREIISVFLIFSIVTEMIALSLDVSVTIFKMVKDEKKQKKENTNNTLLDSGEKGDV